MNQRSVFLVLVAAGVVAAPVTAFPPAPFHRVFGMIRDDHGHPLGPLDGYIILVDSDGREIVRAPTDPATGPGINYSLSVPMDYGLKDRPAESASLRSAYPFIIRVLRGNQTYVPIQMQGTEWTIGDPSASTRIDLTLGIDSDNDGLPDAWELETIRTGPAGSNATLSDITPDGDFDGDGFTNYQEYLAGTYASNPKEGLYLYIQAVEDDMARLEFNAIARRTYRVTTSTDLETFVEIPFTIVPRTESQEPGPPVTSFRTVQTGLVRVLVPMDDVPRRTFRLHVD